MSGGGQWEEAFSWYLRAAEAGSGEAQLHVAKAYRFGIGVSKDDELASSWYQRAAESGNEEAQEHVAQKEQSHINIDTNWHSNSPNIFCRYNDRLVGSDRAGTKA